MGVILAVAGSAVGLGNFLRFPGQVAEHGGGAFMIAYFIGFILVGIPLCWAEWAVGRRAGKHGLNSYPSILAVIVRHPWGKYVGILGIMIPTTIYIYYVYIEAWCLTYAVNFMLGRIDFQSIADSGSFFEHMVGMQQNGAAFNFGLEGAGSFLLLVFFFNFYLIYRGIHKGIEWFCKWAMPLLVVIAVIITVKVLTLGTPDLAQPENNIEKGMGFMWNPNKTHLEKFNPEQNKWYTVDMLLGEESLARAEERVASDPGNTYRIQEITIWNRLQDPQLWLAAIGQILFSLSIGLGVIATYASYLRSRDDIALSSLTAASANEVCEVTLGGMMTIPAAVAFIGVAGLAGMTSTFALGFYVIPMVFASMGTVEILGITFSMASFFGAAFFFLLFLAAITSSISVLQPGISFIEEYLFVSRRASVTIMALVTAVGIGVVVYFSENLLALDTMDFWAGTFLIFVIATIEIIAFGWILGVREGFEEANEGSAIRIPRLFYWITKYVTPLVMITVFLFWVRSNLWVGEKGEPSGYVKNLFYEPNTVAWISVGVILGIGLLAVLVIRLSPLAFPFRSLSRQSDTKEDLL